MALLAPDHHVDERIIIISGTRQRAMILVLPPSPHTAVYILVVLCSIKEPTVYVLLGEKWGKKKRKTDPATKFGLCKMNDRTALIIIGISSCLHRLTTDFQQGGIPRSGKQQGQNGNFSFRESFKVKVQNRPSDSNSRFFFLLPKCTFEVLSVPLSRAHTHTQTATKQWRRSGS
jgi:hypothetical protein